MGASDAIFFMFVAERWRAVYAFTALTWRGAFRVRLPGRRFGGAARRLAAARSAVSATAETAVRRGARGAAVQTRLGPSFADRSALDTAPLGA